MRLVRVLLLDSLVLVVSSSLSHLRGVPLGEKCLERCVSEYTVVQYATVQYSTVPLLYIDLYRCLYHESDQTNQTVTVQ